MLDFILGRDKAKKRKEDAKKAAVKKMANDSNFGSQYAPGIDLIDDILAPSVKNLDSVSQAQVESSPVPSDSSSTSTSTSTSTSSGSSCGSGCGGGD